MLVDNHCSKTGLKLDDESRRLLAEAIARAVQRASLKLKRFEEGDYGPDPLASRSALSRQGGRVGTVRGRVEVYSPSPMPATSSRPRSSAMPRGALSHELERGHKGPDVGPGQAAAVAICQAFVASDRKVRSVLRETRWR